VPPMLPPPPPPPPPAGAPPPTPAGCRGACGTGRRLRAPTNTAVATGPTTNHATRDAGAAAAFAAGSASFSPGTPRPGAIVPGPGHTRGAEVVTADATRKASVASTAPAAAAGLNVDHRGHAPHETNQKDGHGHLPAVLA
jgi:hypothetical protein